MDKFEQWEWNYKNAVNERIIDLAFDDEITYQEYFEAIRFYQARVRLFMENLAIIREREENGKDSSN